MTRDDTEALNPEFEQLLEFVRDSRAFDYTEYKRPSLMRRFQKRMQAVGTETYDDYRGYLEAEPREFDALFDTILINVTSFFRDPAAWQYVAEEVIPRILERKAERGPVRVWSAGCATGQEAYTAAIILAEALAGNPYGDRVKIYATDLDDDALAQARQAIYPAAQAETIPEDLREKYLVETNGGFTLRADIRRSVIFGRNDLLSDPPISRVDLLVSRNTLMYFNPAAQQKVLSNFYFALEPDGYLFLGKAEALQSRTKLFTPVHLKHRVFTCNASVRPRRAPPELTEAVPSAREDERMHESAFDTSPTPGLVVNLEGVAVAVNRSARTLFGLNARDVGRPLRDLEVSYRPLELRSRIDRVLDERRPLVERGVPATISGAERAFDVYVTPLHTPSGHLAGVGIAFLDVTQAETLRGELETARRELDTAYEELQSTVEELETTNEELQSTNEELETTNEELQSTNEELETMNEELQSTNEELVTMNDELQERTDDAIAAHAFLSSVLGSIPAAIIVLDRELVVTAWSEAAANLWGLRADEAEGQFFLNLDIGLPVDGLRDAARTTLAGGSPEPVSLAAHDRRGRPVTAVSRLSPLTGPGGKIEGVILTTDADGADR